jgi:hypothetical protein
MKTSYFANAAVGLTIVMALVSTAHAKLTIVQGDRPSERADERGLKKVKKVKEDKEDKKDKTDEPTSAPVPNEQTSAPLPNVSTFRIKMHWEESYFWQEEDDERQYCLECATCKKLTKSGWGEGCKNSKQCKTGDQLWLQTCNGFVKGASGNAEFEIVRGKVANQIKISNMDLCLERASKLYINLVQCDAADVRQLWTGFDKDKPFELRPVEQQWRPNDYGDPVEIQRCISQHHDHPKNFEVLFLETCDLGIKHNTVLWDVI